MAAGDAVILRLPRPGGTSRPKAPWAASGETVRSLRLTVSAIVPAEGLGRFGLRPASGCRATPTSRLLNFSSELGEPGRVNAILAGGQAVPTPGKPGR